MVVSYTHQYFYQVQAQLYFTCLPWCDFVVWCPNKEIHVERIQHFIMQAIAKARIFYFDVFLPSIVPCVLIILAVLKMAVQILFMSLRMRSMKKKTHPFIQKLCLLYKTMTTMIAQLCVFLKPIATSYHHCPMFCISCILEGMQLMVMETAYIMLLLTRLVLLDMIVVGTLWLHSS